MPKLKTSSIKPVTLRRTNFDLSKALSEPENTTVLTWQEPDTVKLFEAPTLVPKLRRDNPEWTPALCRIVALLALCHIGPETEDDPRIFYQEIARQSPHLFTAISETFNSAFPELENFGVAIADAKNESRA